MENSIRLVVIKIESFRQKKTYLVYKILAVMLPRGLEGHLRRGEFEFDNQIFFFLRFKKKKVKKSLGGTIFLKFS